MAFSWCLLLSSRHQGKLQPVLLVSALLCDSVLHACVGHGVVFCVISVSSSLCLPSKLSKMCSDRQHSAAFILGLPAMSSGAKKGM